MKKIYNTTRIRVLILLLALPTLVLSQNKYWVANSSGDWSNPANWSLTSGGAGGAGIPTNLEKAYFDANGTGNCNIDTDTDISGLFLSGYNGEINISANYLKIGSDGYHQETGSFNGGNTTLIIYSTGTFELAGGTFTSTSTTLMFDKTWSATLTETIFTHSGGTFNHNNGTLEFQLGVGGWNYWVDAVLNIMPTTEFNNILIGNKSTWSNYPVIRPVSGTDVNVRGNLYYDRAYLEGDWYLYGDLDVKAGAIGIYSSTTEIIGNGKIHIVGDSDQAYTYESGGKICNLIIAKPSGSFLPATGTTDFSCATLTIESGIFEAPTNTLHIGAGLKEETAIFFQTGGIFNHNNGTILLEPTNKYYSSRTPLYFTIDILETSLINNLEIDANKAWSETIIKPVDGKTINVSGNLTLQDGYIEGEWNVQGDLYIEDEAGFEYGTVTLNGATTQEYHNQTGIARMCKLVIDKPSGQVQAGTETAIFKVREYELRSGTFIAPQELHIGHLGYPTGTHDMFTHSGGTFNHNNGTVIFDGTVQAGNYRATLNIKTQETTQFNNLVLDGNNGFIFATPENTVQILKDLTHEDGNVSGNWSVLGNLYVKDEAYVGQGTIRLVGAADQYYNNENGIGRTSNIIINKPAGIVQAGAGTTKFNAAGLFIESGTFIAPQELHIGYFGYPTGTHDMFTHSGGTFNHNNGTVIFDGTVQAGNYKATLNIKTQETTQFNNLILDGNNVFIFDTPDENTVQILKDLTHEDGIVSGDWSVLGNLYVKEEAYVGQGTIRLVGATDQYYYSENGIGRTSNIIINKPSGIVQAGAGTTKFNAAGLFIESGTFIAPQELHIGYFGYPTGTHDMFTHSGGTFNHNNGTVIFDGTVQAGNYKATLNIKTQETTQFNNLILDGNNVFIFDAPDENTVQILKDLTHEDGIVSGDWSVLGNLYVKDEAYVGQGTIRLVGAADQYYNNENGIGRTSNIIINKPSGIVQAGAGTTKFNAAGLFIESGTFIAPQELHIGYFGYPTGTHDIFTHSGGEFNHNNGTVIFDASLIYNNIATLNINTLETTLFNNLVLDGNASNNYNLKFDMPEGSVVHIQKNLTHEDGVMNGNWAVLGDLYVDNEATAGLGIISLEGTTDQYYHNVNGIGRTSILEINKPSGSVQAGVGTTIFNISGLFIESGTFIAPQELHIGYSSYTGGTYDVFSHSGGEFNHNNETVVFDAILSYNHKVNLNIKTLESTFFNKVILDGTASSIWDLKYETPEGSIVQVQNDLVHELGILNGEWSISGDLYLGEGVYLSSGTIHFDGSTDQTINSNLAIESRLNGNLEINKPSGKLILNNGLQLDQSGQTLSLNNGNLQSTTDKLLIIGQGVTIENASANSFVEGAIKKTGNEAFIFPLGKETSYRPISISAPSTITDEFTAEYFNQAQSLGDNMVSELLWLSDCEYWTLEQNIGTSTTNVSLSWDENTCGIINPENLRVASWDGTQWTDRGQAAITGDATSGSITSDLTNSYGTFTIAKNQLDLTRVAFLPESCGLEDMPFYQTLRVEEQSAADQYEFSITKLSTGYNETVIKDIPEVRLTDMKSPVETNTEYAIQARALINSIPGEYGDACVNKTRGLKQILACQESYIQTDTITILNTQDTIRLIVELQSDGIQFIDSAYITGASGNVSIVSITGNNAEYKVTDLNNTSFRLVYCIKPQCGIFNLNLSGSQDSIYIYEEGINIGNTLSEEYNINTPVITFIPEESENISYLEQALWEGSFMRSFYFKNTGQYAENITFKFLDTLDNPYENTSIKFENLSLVEPLNGVTILNTLCNDSVVEITIQFDTLGALQHFVIGEQLKMFRCQDFVDLSYTKFSGSYGCDSSNLCKDVSFPLGNTSVASYNSDTWPVLVYNTQDSLYADCLSDTIKRIYSIKNDGGSAATGVFLHWTDHPDWNYNDFTVIDTSTIEMHRANGDMMNLMYTDSFYNAAYPYAYVSYDSIYSGETVYYSYKEYISCIDEQDFDGYDKPRTIHNKKPLADLLHPCKIDDKKPQKILNKFYLKQYSVSDVNTMLDAEEAWFDLVSDGDVMLGEYSYKYFYDISKCEYVVELNFVQGLDLFFDSLSLSFDSLFLESVDTNFFLLYPDTIKLVEGTGVLGSGNKYLVKFTMPDTFYTYNVALPYKSYSDDSGMYGFFKAFHTKFKVKAYCEYIENPFVPEVTQKVRFVTNNTCSEDCAVPLYTFSKKVQVHCPGCFIPGWNLQGMEIKRENFGLSDADNNSFPDSIPCNTCVPDIARANRVMLGDTLSISTFGYVSNGENEFVISLMGVDYKYGQFVLKGNLFDYLKFIDGHGEYRDYDTDSILDFTFDTTDVLINNNTEYTHISEGDTITEYVRSFSFKIDSAFFIKNGHTDIGFKEFYVDDEIELFFRFVVEDNLVLEGDYMEYYDVNAMMNMSGTPYLGVDLKEDALLVDYDVLSNMPDSLRKELNYWCTGWDESIEGIGFGYTYDINLNRGFSGEYLSPCLYWAQPISQFMVGTNSFSNSTENTYNSFSYELRNLAMLDTVSFTFPDYFELDYIKMKTFQITTETPEGVHQPVSSALNEIFIDNYTLDNTSITIYPSQLLSLLYDAPLPRENNTEHFCTYDEYKSYIVRLSLKMKDFHETPPYISMAPYNIKFVYSGYPGEVGGNNTIIKPYNNGYPNNSNYSKPEANLHATTFAGFIPEANGGISSEMQLKTDSTGWYEGAPRINAQKTLAENTFILFENTSMIHVDSVVYIGSNINISVDSVGVINGNTLYGLGNIGPTPAQTADIKVYANYDCSQLQEGQTESIKCYYGWNCYEYPRVINADSICFLDSLDIVASLYESGIQATLNEPAQINICDTVDYSITLRSSGDANVNNIVINGLISEDLTLVPNSSFVVRNFVVDSVNVEYNLDTLIWDLSGLNNMQTFKGDTAILKFSFKSTCLSESPILKFIVNAENYCGKKFDSIPPLDHILTYTPDFPESNQLSLTLSASPIQLCGVDSSLVSASITNVGTIATSAYNQLEVTLPSGFSYSSGATYSDQVGQTLIFDLTEGILQGNNEQIEFYIRPGSTVSCGNIDIQATAKANSVLLCGGNICYGTSNDSSATATLNIEAPTVFITAFDINAKCIGTENIATITIENTSGINANSITLSFYNQNENLLDEMLININSSSIDSFTYDLTSFADSIESVYAVLSSACICYSFTSETINFSNLEASYTVQNVLCNGGSTGEILQQSINGTQPYTYAWSTGATSDNLTNISQGVYEVTITDAIGCQLTNSFTVTEPDEISYSITATNVLCYGDSTGIANASHISGGTPPYSYLWSNGATTNPAIYLLAGGYQLTISDVNGCQLSKRIRIYQPQELISTMDVYNIACNGGHEDSAIVTVSGGTPEYSYLWSNGSTANIIENVPAGTYIVTITDHNNCVVLDTATITEPEPIQIETEIISPTCFGGSDGSATITANGGISPYTYVWSTGATTNPATNLQAGNYELTIYDANLCDEDFDININQPDEILLTADTIIPACKNNNNGAIDLSINNGTPPYSYLWSNESTTEDIDSLEHITYFVTVTDTNGCSSSASFNVPDINVPTSNFSLPDCMTMNDTMQFSVNPTSQPDPVYQWTFSDGAVDTSETFSHIFSNFGYYCLKLEASNVCGVSSNTELVYINPDACACNPDYDVYDGKTYSYNFEWADTMYIEGDVFIDSSYTLTIADSAIIHFAPKGRLIVKQGATLDIKNYATLTSLEGACNYMWQGIEVWGNSSDISGSASQGIVTIGTSVEIKNAHIAILSGARNLDYICDSTLNTKYTLAYSGGIIRNSKPAIFNNNGVGIRFIEKQYPYEASTNNLNKCYFNCTGLLDNLYNSANVNSYPNAQNPYTGYANEDGRTYAGFWINKQQNMILSENTYTNMQYGIYAFDSKFNVESDIFSNLEYGIYISNVSTSLYNRKISLCNFDYMSEAAIYVNAGKYDNIYNNTFGTPTSNQVLNYRGIYMDNSSAFNICNNTLNNFTTGVEIYNSNRLGGFVGAANDDDDLEASWRGNTFNTCRISIVTNTNNPKLILRCNNSTNDSTQYSGTNWNTSGSLSNQGAPIPHHVVTLYKARYAAGNEFYPENNEYMKVVQSNNITYNYYRHSGPAYVIPNDDGSPATINIYSTGIAKTSNSSACPRRIVLIEIDEVLLERVSRTRDSLRILTDDYETTYDNMMLNLDNGLTDELISDIITQMPAGKLKNKLINNSPLSIEVLYALITEGDLSPGDFKNVMEANLPVSKQIEPEFYNKLKTLPEGIAMQLKALQAYNPDVITPASLQQEIADIETEYQLFLNDAITALVDSPYYNTADAIALLEAETDIASKQTLAATYLSNEDYDLAKDKLSEIVSDDDAINDWVLFSQMMIDLYENNLSLENLTNEQLIFVRELAYQCPAGLASANAQAILKILYNEDVADCPDNLMAKSASIQSETKPLRSSRPERFIKETYLGDNYPEPAKTITRVDYYLPENHLGKLILNNTFGNKISEVDLLQGENSVEIDVSKLAPGVYIYSLEIDSKLFSSKKMIVIQ